MDLLAGEMVRLTSHKTLSRDTVGRRLAEMTLKPWQEKMWCIPTVNPEFVARMEDVLALYAEPLDPLRPVVCFLGLVHGSGSSPQAGHGATDSLDGHAGAEVTDPRPTAEQDARRAQIETVLAAWRVWHGDFGAFCAHVRRDHRLELGNTLIASILFAHGARTPARRAGRSRDEEALRGSFETFFPGAQWVGDGKELEVVLDGKTFCMNLELIIDAASDAAVGISVRDEEDSAAVIEAFEHGKETTGGSPLAQLLDNRPSNHTPEVDAALDATMRIRATPARPQNKVHVEGTFGLFAR